MASNLCRQSASSCSRLHSKDKTSTILFNVFTSSRNRRWRSISIRWPRWSCFSVQLHMGARTCSKKGRALLRRLVDQRTVSQTTRVEISKLFANNFGNSVYPEYLRTHPRHGQAISWFWTVISNCFKCSRGKCVLHLFGYVRQLGSM